MRKGLIIAALLALAGCGDAQRAKDIVSADLRDPDSAQWRNIRTAKWDNGVTYVCGEVNAKNGFGAYGGFEPFVVDVNAGTVVYNNANRAMLDCDAAQLQGG
jgi:hypothetical protein